MAKRTEKRAGSNNTDGKKTKLTWKSIDYKGIIPQ